MGTQIDIFGASHGNETLGLAVHAAFEADPRPGVRSRIAHPEAAALGRRFLGTSQITDHYPGSLTGDPEDVAAAKNMEWLGEHAGSEEVVVKDIHCNDIAGDLFCAVGTRALKASMGSALLLGQRTFVTRPDPFHIAVPNTVVLEHPILSRAEERRTAAWLYRNLAEIATLDIDRLREVYEAAAPGLTFWNKHEVVLEPLDFTANITVADDPELLARLEAIPWQPALTEIALSDDLRSALNIRGSGRVLVEVWSYRNMSPERPDLGMFEGRPRRLGFGALFEETGPPKDDGAWVEFHNSV